MSTLFSLKEKVIVVTGGAGILGTGFVEAIAGAGGAVAIIDLNEELATQNANRINAAGGKALAVKASVLSEEDLTAAREKIVAHFGKIDGLVNAAGGNVPEGVLQPDADVFALNIEGMKKAMVLNLWGTVIPSQIFGSELVKSGSGSIINISSVSSKRALTRVLGYSMGKAAVDIYTQWFAVEVAKRHGDVIRVNAIMPGFFLTNQNRTLIYLLSDASKFVTGMQMGVDGGFTTYSGV